MGRVARLLGWAGAATLLALVSSNASGAPQTTSADDDIIIIVEEDPPGSPDGGVAPKKAAPVDDDIIIIEEEDAPRAPPSSPFPPPPQLPNLPRPGILEGAQFPPLPLGEFPPLPLPADPSSGDDADGRSFLGFKASHIALTGRFGGRSGFRPLGNAVNDLSRSLADAVLAVDVRPDMPLRLHVDVLARFRWATGASIPMPAGTTAQDVANAFGGTTSGTRVGGLLEIGEAWGSVRMGPLKVTLGRQLFAWASTPASPVVSILNAPFARDGLAFPDDLQGRTATLAATVQGTVGKLSLELMAAPLYAPPRFSMFAEDAEAFEPHDGTASMVTSRAAFRNDAAAASLEHTAPSPDRLVLGNFAPTVGTRAAFPLAGVDMSVVVLLGQDPMPVIHAPKPLAMALAAAADRQGNAAVNHSLGSTCAPDVCPSLGGATIGYRQTLVAQVEAAAALGPGVLRGTFHGTPALGQEVGRSVQVITKDGTLESVRAWSAGALLAYETGYTELVQGFVELGYEVLGGIPDGSRIARVESVDQGTAGQRLVHKPTAGIRVQGLVLDDIAWRLRALVSPWQREVALAPRLGYRLSLNQEVGLGSELYAGVPGTRGWFLMPLSRVYADWVYRF